MSVIYPEYKHILYVMASWLTITYLVPNNNLVQKYNLISAEYYYKLILYIWVL